MSITFPRVFANLTLAQLSYLDDNFTAINTAIDAANGIAGLDANNRLVRPANTVWDGVGNRAASPTPAPNTIPVTDGSGALNFPATGLGLADFYTTTGASAPLTPNMPGPYHNGDVIFCQVGFIASITGPAGIAPSFQSYTGATWVNPASGQNYIRFTYHYGSGGTDVFQYACWSFVVKITSTGSFQPQWTGNTTWGTIAISSWNFMGFAIKKQ